MFLICSNQSSIKFREAIVTSFEWAIAVIGAGSMLFSLWLRVAEDRMEARSRSRRGFSSF